MNSAFVILGILTLGSAVAAMSMRNLVHSALCLVVTFVGLAGLYLELRAEFVGWVQILVYVGAVAIVLVFTVLLTRSGGVRGPVIAPAWLAGLVIAGLVAATLAGAIFTSAIGTRLPGGEPKITVEEIGRELMGPYVVPLEAMGLLLTVALIGAIVLAMHNRGNRDLK